jgi:signal transduction histidine kinase
VKGASFFQGPQFLRFDDSLETVLSAEMSTAFGAQSAWRQLVDLIGRGRVTPAPAALERLEAIRAQVAEPVRAASARGLVGAEPPAAIVRLFAKDEASIAAPVLRSARLEAAEWAAILPEMSPSTRAILRHRRDLDPEVQRALDSFGSTDFVLSQSEAESGAAVSSEPAITAAPPPRAPLGETSFVAVGAAARELPVVAEALRHAATADPVAPPQPASDGSFAISDIVARIDAFQKHREEHGPAAAMPATPAVAPTGFRFSTDAAGLIRWVNGVERGALIGLSLALASGAIGVDGAVSGAFRRRAPITDARLNVAGQSDAGGTWRITALPVFDQANGRFTGYRGTARRPRLDEFAEPRGKTAASDSLRQLVHELRTPTNAIAGFAEMIEAEILGPVSAEYRERAGAIRTQAADLIAAIEDIDMAARIDARALDLREGAVAIAPMLHRVAVDLEPLLTLRGAAMMLASVPPALAASGDERAIERLVQRLMATLAAAATRGENLKIDATHDGARAVVLAFDRPAALADRGGDALLEADAEVEAEAAETGAPLLGSGFALRLARNLAAELGGSLAIASDRLTLRLPAAFIAVVEQAGN